MVLGTKGAKDANFSPIAVTSSNNLSGSTRRVIRPIWSAFSALIVSPIRSISIAQPLPTVLGSRAVAPPPGIKPSLPYGVANLDRVVAIRKSQPNATSSPPPIHIPSIAASVGFGVRSNFSAKP